MAFAFTMGMEAVFGDSAGKVEEVWAAVVKLTEAFVELAERGDEVSDAMKGVEPRMIELAKAATNGEVSALRLAQALQRMRAAGLDPTAEQFAIVARNAKDFADRTGGDAVAATEALATAIVRGSERGLKPYGIHLEKGISDTEKMTSAMRQLEERANHLTEDQTTLGDSITHLSTAWDDLTDAFAKGLTEGHSIENLITHLATLLEGAAFAAEVFGRGVASAMHMPGVDLLLRAMARFGPTVGPELASSAVPQEPAAGSIGALNVQSYPSSGEIPGRVSRGRGGGGGRGYETLPEQTVGGEAQNEYLQTQAAAEEAYQEQSLDQWLNYQGAIAESHQQSVGEWQSYADAMKATHQQEMEAAERYAQGISQIAMQGAELLGLGEAEKLYIKGTSEAVFAAIAFAKGPLFYLEGVSHALAAAIAFKGAQDLRSQAGGKGGHGSASAGGGGGGGLGAGPVGSSGGGSGGGGGNTIIINVPGTLAGKREIEDAIVEGVTRAHDRGNGLPERVKKAA